MFYSSLRLLVVQFIIITSQMIAGQDGERRR
jgi:hypothetical protein